MVRLIQQPTAGVDLLDWYRQTGSPDVFAQIMRAYGGMVLSVCYKVTKDSADAEDASQAVFLTLAVQCKTGSPIQYLGPWLKKVAKRTALDLVRSRKRRTRRETVTAENRPEHYTIRPGAAPEADEQNAILRAELDQLPAKYRMPLVLHYFGGLSHDQISKEMNCTTAALGVRLHRARKMLGKRLAARNVTLEGAALGAAIAATVGLVMTDRLIGKTAAAMAGLGYTAPASGAVASVAGLPDNLAAVLHLVANVGSSMARAKMRMAALAFACSLSLLGGAAEATRFLPESIRPALEFLAPSAIIKSLLQPSLPSFEFHTPTVPTVRVSSRVDLGADDDTTAAAPATPVTGPFLTAATNQPVLALQWTGVPAPQPAVPATPLSLPKLAINATTAPRTVGFSTMAAAATPTVAARFNTASAGFRSAAGGSDSQAAPAADTPSNDPIHGAGGGGNGGGDRPLPQALPDGKGRPTQNVPPPPRTVRAFAASSVGGATFDSVPVPPSNPLKHPTGPLQLPGGDAAFVPDSAIVGHGDVFVGGDGVYHWSDTPAGITAGGTNAADLLLSGVTGTGLVHIERLPVTTLQAPVRPLGHHFVGIWSLEARGFHYDTVTLTAHYDAAFAQSLGLDENILKLWIYDDGAWTRIMDTSFVRDLDAHTLVGTYHGEPAYFAVSAPEPTLLGVGTVVGGLLLRRRRRS